MFIKTKFSTIKNRNKKKKIVGRKMKSETTKVATKVRVKEVASLKGGSSLVEEGIYSIG